LEDFHVSHTQWLEKDKEQTMIDISGRSALDLLESSGRTSVFGKMFLALLIGQEGWYSSRCALTWKVKGTKYNRLYCQLAASTLRTGEIGSGLLPIMLPSPVSSDATTGAIIGKNDTFKVTSGLPRKVNQNGTDGSVGLGRIFQIMPGLLKTPTKMDGEVTSGKKNPVSGDSGKLEQEIMSGYEPTMMKLGLLPTAQARDWKGKSGGVQKGTDLPSIAEMLPTPTTRDWKDCFQSQEKLNDQFKKRDSLGIALTVGYLTGQTSQLNPLFVLEMMGFPPNWTELPFQSGEKNQSKPQETQ
jgi:hypothetical protein